MPNEIYHRSEWGNPKAEGFGDVYFDASATNKLYNHSDNYENSDGTDKILRDIPNKASIVLTPTAYSDGSLNTVIPPYQVLPQELVTPTDSTINWINARGNSTLSVVGGKIRATITSGTTFGVSTAISTVIGKTYSIKSDGFKSNANGDFLIRVSNVASLSPAFYEETSSNSQTISTNGTFVATATTTYVGLLATLQTVGDYIETDNVSVKEVQEADFDFSRGSSATRVNEQGLIEEVASNIPRIDYTSGQGALLLEPQSTNSVTYSNDFSNSDWIKQSGISSTYNTTETLSPEGLNNASKFTGNGTNGVYRQAIVTGVVTRSIYLKSVTGNVSVTIKDPVLTVTTKTLNLNETWQRFELIESNGHGSLSGIWIDDIPASGIYMYGAQVEAGSYATSYIPTEGSTVTRSADVANNSGNADLINSTEGVLYAEIAALNDDTQQQIGIYGNSISKQIRLEITNSVIRGALFNGAFQAILSSTQTVTDFNKIAFKYKENDFALWVNGIEVATDSVGLTFPANDLDRVNLTSQGGSSLSAQANVKSVAVFKEALTDAELQALTT